MYAVKSCNVDDEPTTNVCRAEGAIAAAAKAQQSEPKVVVDDLDEIIMEHNMLVEKRRSALISQLAGAATTEDELVELRSRGIMDDKDVGSSDPLDWIGWKRNLRHVWGKAF